MLSLSRIIHCHEAPIIALLYEACFEHRFDLCAACLKLLVLLLHCYHLLFHLLNLLEFLLQLSLLSICPSFIFEDFSLRSTPLCAGLHEMTTTTIANYME